METLTAARGKTIRMRMAAIDAPEVRKWPPRRAPVLTSTADGHRKGIRRTAVLNRVQRLATKPDLGEDHLLSTSQARRVTRTNGGPSLPTTEIPVVVTACIPRDQHVGRDCPTRLGVHLRITGGVSAP